MKIIAAILLALLLPSCVTTGDYMLVYAGDSIEVQGIAAAGPNDATGVGYNRVTKRAYITFANGEKTALKVTGGGIGGNAFVLVLEGGTKVSVDLKTGKVTTSGPQFEALSQK